MSHARHFAGVAALENRGRSYVWNEAGEWVEVSPAVLSTWEAEGFPHDPSLWPITRAAIEMAECRRRKAFADRCAAIFELLQAQAPECF